MTYSFIFVNICHVKSCWVIMFTLMLFLHLKKLIVMICESVLRYKGVRLVVIMSCSYLYDIPSHYIVSFVGVRQMRFGVQSFSRGRECREPPKPITPDFRATINPKRAIDNGSTNGLGRMELQVKWTRERPNKKHHLNPKDTCRERFNEANKQTSCYPTGRFEKSSKEAHFRHIHILEEPTQNIGRDKNQERLFGG